MGFLVIISETGFPHSACLFIINGQRQWRGFKPKKLKMPVCEGYVDESDRTQFIDNANVVKFEVDDSVLNMTLETIRTTYNGLTYRVGIGPDCVNLAVDVAKLCGLKTPPPPNMSPNSLVENLKKLNSNWLNY
ncbi:MAG: hypothetical protein N5P05_002685 [Chroococcopsis gigantea SAG 12.99]|jgi:hypothetical protein|nr:hypothetical protein [Chlorogloea purpurea SAG 13.99]MDV3001079.1 hypothetical protein [Chroococcopsis gigantea SAG 12.99]